ncbi:hypothetical protein EB796_004920 [Bugula neritina]|nr:hypothetical protein EB796_004920 [Bugula neritina]
MNVPKHKMSAASKSSAKSKESVLTNHKAKSHAEVEERDSHKKKSTSKKSISKTRSENEHPDINPVNVTPEINIESRSKDFLAFQ